MREANERFEITVAVVGIIVVLAIVFAGLLLFTEDQPRVSVTVPDTVKVVLICTSEEIQRTERLDDGMVRYTCEDR